MTLKNVSRSLLVALIAFESCERTAIATTFSASTEFVAAFRDSTFSSLLPTYFHDNDIQFQLPHDDGNSDSWVTNLNEAKITSAGLGVSALAFGIVDGGALQSIYLDIGSRSRAQVATNSFVITQNGSGSGFVSTSVNVSLDGAIAEIDEQPGLSYGYVTLNAYVQIISGSEILLDENAGFVLSPGGGFGTGLLAGGTIVLDPGGGLSPYTPPALTTSAVLLPVGKPLAVILGIEAILEEGFFWFAGDQFISFDSGIDFTHTFGFATLGPVFNLPAGYSANAAELGIVNNQFVGIPEPESLVLAALACVMSLVAAILRNRFSFAIPRQYRPPFRTVLFCATRRSRGFGSPK